MAKTFYTSGTGSQQTLTPSQNEKVAIYDTIADAEADLANLEAGQIVATPDTGDELAQPVDVIQAGNMHAVTSNAVAESLSYPTTEQKTGGVWVDGKPIYRKVIDFGALPNNTSKSVSIPVSNLDMIISVKGIAVYGNTAIPLPSAMPTDLLQYAISLEISNGNIQIVTRDDRSVLHGYIFIEYIKTTD